MIWEDLNEKFILTGLEADSKEEVFRRLGSPLIKEGYCKQSYIQALTDREIKYPTGLDMHGIGVAIPHTDASHVIHSTQAVAVLKKPVKFEVMGADEGEFVDVWIVVAMAIKDPGKHLDQVKVLLKILQDQKVLTQLKQAKTAKEVIEIFKKKEALL